MVKPLCRTKSTTHKSTRYGQPLSPPSEKRVIFSSQAYPHGTSYPKQSLYESSHQQVMHPLPSPVSYFDFTGFKNPVNDQTKGFEKERSSWMFKKSQCLEEPTDAYAVNLDAEKLGNEDPHMSASAGWLKFSP